MIKKLIIISMIMAIAGCASQKTTQSPSQSKRVPTGFGDLQSSELPNLTSLNQLSFQGPFEIPADDTDRASAKIILPIQYDDKAQWPMVVLLHGFSGTAESEDIYLGLRYRASLRGFILLAPEGTSMPKGTLSPEGKDLGGNQFWNATDACCDFGKTAVDDEGYILSLIESVKKKYKVDSNKVYIFGHSNGGFMAERLSCSGTDIAGVAVLGSGTYKDSKDCGEPAPVRYLHIHAEDDSTIQYGRSKDYAGGKEAVDQMLERNKCSAKHPPLKSEADHLFLIPGKDTKKETWTQCDSNEPVEFWTIKAFDGSKLHNPHIPLFNLSAMGATLDFLFNEN